MPCEFVCDTCRWPIADFSCDVPPDPPRCGLCVWLVIYVPDPAERARMIYEVRGEAPPGPYEAPDRRLHPAPHSSSSG